MPRSANPSMVMVKIYAANAEAGCHQEPKVGDPKKCRKRSVDPSSLGRLPGPLEQMKSRYSRNRCSGDQPVCNRRKTGSSQENTADAQQQSVTKPSLIQRLEAQKGRQPSRAESPDSRNNERIRPQGQESGFKDHRKRRPCIVQTHEDGNYQVQQ